MRRLVSLFLLPLAALAALALAQDDKAPSRSTAAIDSVTELVRNQVAGSKNPKKVEVTANNPMHLVFLVDTSQANRDDYREFVGKFIAGVLGRLGKDQSAIHAPDAKLHDVQFFPYQMDLIDEAGRTLTPPKTLKKGAGTVDAIMGLIPASRIPVTGETSRGHLSAKSRRTLIDKLGPASGDRETVIFQITPRDRDADPDHPENDVTVKTQNAYNANLEGTDYVAYNGGGTKWQTDPMSANLPSTDVFVWVYGPAKFVVDELPTPPKPVPHPEPHEDPKPFPFVLVLGGLVVLLVVGYVVYRLVAKFPVKVGNERARVGTLNPLAIKTSGGKGGDRVIVIPKERQGTLGPDLKIGEITVPLLFGGPQVYGSGGYTMKLNAATPPGPQPLTKKAINVTFSKGENATDPVSLSL